MNPMIKGTLDGVLGNSFVEHKQGYGGPIHEWGYDHRQEEQAKRESGWYAASREHPEVGLMNPQEFEEWKKANGLPPTVRSTGALGGPVTPPETPWSIGGVKTMEWNYDRDGQNPLEGFGPIGPYNPDTDESKVVPLDFPNEGLLAKGKSPFSTPHWDKQDDIRKYLENIRRLKERGLLGGLPKA